MTEERSCGCVIFSTDTAETRVLITQNKKGVHWSFPKGHVEGNETDIETAVREVREETGLTVQPYPLFTIVNRYLTSRKAMKTVVYFIATASINSKLSLQPSEVRDAKWLTVPEAKTKLTYENDRKILADAANYIKTRR